MPRRRGKKDAVPPEANQITVLFAADPADALEEERIQAVREAVFSSLSTIREKQKELARRGKRHFDDYERQLAQAANLTAEEVAGLDITLPTHVLAEAITRRETDRLSMAMTLLVTTIVEELKLGTFTPAS